MPLSVAAKLYVFVMLLLLSVGYKKYRVYLSSSGVMFVKIIELVRKLEWTSVFMHNMMVS